MPNLFYCEKWYDDFKRLDATMQRAIVVISVVISVDVVRGHFPLCRDDLTIQPVQFSPEEDLGEFKSLYCA